MRYTDIIDFHSRDSNAYTIGTIPTLGVGFVLFSFISAMNKTGVPIVSFIVLGPVILYGLIPGAILLFDRFMVSLDQAKSSPVYSLKACVKIAKLCNKMPEADSGMKAQINSLAKQIYKYGEILLSRSAVINEMADSCSDQNTSKKLRAMADERIGAATKVASKFQSLLPSIISGSYADEIAEIEADLEQVKTIIDNTNNEIISTSRKPIKMTKVKA